ncbi:protein kinase domain-containing protein [Streptomyces zhihengii]|uniref:PQQ-binding-like beta-propeller repeat protein n=1 Tax=Streptomyces zhihengii TaxID=1818004 RepID=A0ABS2UKG0_9ACTN|nr:serine/threonine-protein kinase [Streptomyces zhihengii]MBM9618022.1 PQQ-binding-like beta-propeller repeat protein [Streptomyces zhihengii]
MSGTAGTAPGPHDPRDIGPYRILSVLGTGGMGRVYLGRSRTGRLAAVKVVRSELAADAGYRRRFAREVSAARRVGGEFTAHVIDSAVEGDLLWLATAYVRGPSLYDEMRRQGPLAANDTALLGAALAEALCAIHDAGLVHRDLKPSNVLLAADGPRVIDFGIALAADSTALTDTALMVGTPGYMAPEVLRSGVVSSAADVFALGAVLVFASTGAGPFGTGAALAVNHRAAYEEPDLGAVPAALLPVVRACLAKDPELRPAPARLVELLGEQRTQAAPLAPSSSGDRRSTADRTDVPHDGVPRAVDPDTVTAAPVKSPSHPPTQPARRGFTRSVRVDLARPVAPHGATRRTPSHPARRTLLTGALSLALGGAAYGGYRYVSDPPDRQRWRRHFVNDHTGNNVGIPVPAGRAVYVDTSEGMKALDARNGSTLWTADPPDGRPSVYQRTLYAAGTSVFQDGHESPLVVRAADSGDLLWETDGPSTLLVASEDLLLVTRDGRLRRLDPGTGRQVWSVRADALSAVTGDGMAAVATRTGLMAFDAETGRALWSREQKGWGLPSLGRRALYAAGREGVAAFDPGSGERRWITGATPVAAPPVEAGGLLYVGTHGHSVYALETGSGLVRWKQDSPEAQSYRTSPVVAGSTVYIAENVGDNVGETARMLALASDSGEVRWTHPIGDGSRAGVAYSDGVVFVSTDDGEVLALSA